MKEGEWNRHIKRMRLVYKRKMHRWLIEWASIYGIKVYPTSIYFIENHSAEAIIKLGISNLTFDEIQEGVTRLKEAWEG